MAGTASYGSQMRIYGVAPSSGLFAISVWFSASCAGVPAATPGTPAPIAPREAVGCYILTVREDSVLRADAQRSPAQWMDRSPGRVIVDTIALDSIVATNGWRVPAEVVAWQLRSMTWQLGGAGPPISWWTGTTDSLELNLSDAFVHHIYRLRPTTTPGEFTGEGRLASDDMQVAYYGIRARRADCLGFGDPAT